MFPLSWWVGIALLPVPHVSFGSARMFSIGLAAMGAGLCFGNALTLLVLVVPIAAALLYRIHVEEDALATPQATPASP